MVLLPHLGSDAGGIKDILIITTPEEQPASSAFWVMALKWASA